MSESQPYPTVELAGTQLPQGARAVLAALEAAGHEAWVVGGWVRDALMGAASHDVDLCCSATWEESAAACSAAGIGVVESGTRFGGITAIAGGERVEVTAYRREGFYTDGRHPDRVVAAATVEEDLARRDFTVNAMAWHPVRGLVDLYDGVGDIRRRVIRAVGDPQRRFEEDALRMLRAVRFSARLGFSLEEGTSAALRSCAPLLNAVARERVGWELSGILATGRAGHAMMECPELFCAAVPELAAARGFDQCTKYHVYDVYDHIAHVLSAAEKHAGDGGGTVDPALAWAAFLHDAAKPACFTVGEDGRGHFYGHPQAGARLAQSVMRRLGLADSLVREVALLVRYHDVPIRAERACMLDLLRKLSGNGLDAPRLAELLFDLRCADTLGKAEFCFSHLDELERMRALCRRLVAAGEPYSLRQLAVRGGDLIACGVEPGKRVGELLERALEGCMAGKVENRRDALLAYLGLASG